jgi:hypothetical protein
VLAPAYWGHGAAITRGALDQGFGELGLEAVVIALPYTRSPTRAVARFGFVPDGEVPYDGTSFRQYRLTREAWAAVTWWAPVPRRAAPDADQAGSSSRKPTLSVTW